MGTGFAITTVLEIVVAAFIIWGLFKEEKLALLEEKLFLNVKKAFRKK